MLFFQCLRSLTPSLSKHIDVNRELLFFRHRNNKPKRDFPFFRSSRVILDVIMKIQIRAFDLLGCVSVTAKQLTVSALHCAIQTKHH